MNADDTVDWCDVAAVGLIADVLSTSASRGPVASLLEDLRREWCRDFRGGFTRDVGKAAAALREAHEAGLRERIDVIDCDACGERHMTERGAAMASENRALRRELAARRAVDGWLWEWSQRRLAVEIDERLRAYREDGSWVEAPDYPALVAALGLEVEDE